MKLKIPGIETIDRYIIAKFLGTFFVSIALIISIALVFDVSENLDEFLSKDIPVHDIIFDYYLNFIPYFANLFSSLFNFIAVIYFTSKMAYNSEIIAILSSGVSFHRFVRPYMVGAAIIALFSYVLGDYIIPPANKTMVEFKDAYIKNKRNSLENNIHRQITPGTYIYMRSYNTSNDVGYKFTIERFEEGNLISKLSADFIKWDRERKVWEINNYFIRDIDGYKETITTGTKKDTTLNMVPADYVTMANMAETLALPDLNKEIESLKLRGINTIEYEVEKHKRRANPFSAFILTIIGVSLASRKVKGGLGLHLGLGILISFSYIMFMQISTVFALSGSVPPYIAVWIPNFIFGALAAYLYNRARR
ncbi:LptF/LptG family permease [Mangrovibacterium diazotrophicum]|uniref:Lipopolysaccharide export system permease protein n=1 Tax=Mangrovibacterium diazotrophicum TaxID=1261403 RepID=A0A419WBD3_9BACT|nr:LptF/LptG family permease [Mangrovibacterium diazotrophicum]RKD92775.1 lipopolysaccharide export system permease protein [Mangrovibacterium diazotrophicum]